MVEVSACRGAAAAIADYNNRWHACLVYGRCRPFWAFRLSLTGCGCYNKSRWLQIHILCSILWLQKRAQLTQSPSKCECSMFLIQHYAMQHCRNGGQHVQALNDLLMMGKSACPFTRQQQGYIQMRWSSQVELNTLQSSKASPNDVYP